MALKIILIILQTVGLAFCAAVFGFVLCKKLEFKRFRKIMDKTHDLIDELEVTDPERDFKNGVITGRMAVVDELLSMDSFGK